MTDNNVNKYIAKQPFIPKTETRIFLGGRPIDQQTEPTNSKSVNKQPYQSERVGEVNPGYGPCYRQINYGDCNCGFMINATLVDSSGNSRSETIIPTNKQQIKDLKDRIVLERGEWGYTSYDLFSPHPESRTSLAVWIDHAIAGCGPQRVTLVEGVGFGARRVTINGIGV
jgi:hypothetical protein